MEDAGNWAYSSTDTNMKHTKIKVKFHGSYDYVLRWADMVLISMPRILW